MASLALMTEPFDPGRKGCHAVYREGERNRCPGCGREHWIIGRSTAECAFCSTALPLASQSAEAAIIFRKGGKQCPITK